MKFKTMLLIILLISALAFPAFAGQPDSVEVDTSNVEEHKDDCYIVAIGGLGMTDHKY